MKTRANDPAHPLQEWGRKFGAPTAEPFARAEPGMTKREVIATEIMAGLLHNPAVVKMQHGTVDYTNAKSALAQVAWMAVVGADILIEHLNFEPGPLRDRGEQKEEVDHDA